jgi:Na+-translocating ferredoxin:NAD+ oxidoreductase RnfG subunit
MKLKSFIILIIAGMGFLFMSFELPKNIEKKVHKEVKEVFEVENFSLQIIAVNEQLNTSLPLKIGKDNLFKIFSNDKMLGYVYVGTAPSKTAIFDYMVMFDAELKVNKTKVLIYREEYGGEIGSRRWLRQFIGKSSADKLTYGDNIDAISGATISVKSMTYAMDNLLSTIGKLHELQIL